MTRGFESPPGPAPPEVAAPFGRPSLRRAIGYDPFRAPGPNYQPRLPRAWRTLAPPLRRGGARSRPSGVALNRAFDRNAAAKIAADSGRLRNGSDAFAALALRPSSAGFSKNALTKECASFPVRAVREVPARRSPRSPPRMGPRFCAPPAAARVFRRASLSSTGN